MGRCRTEDAGRLVPQERQASARIVAVRVSDHCTELLLGSATSLDEVLSPFEAASDGLSWRLPRQRELLDEVHADPWVSGMDVLLRHS